MKLSILAWSFDLAPKARKGTIISKRCAISVHQNSKRHDAENQEMRTLLHRTTFWLGASGGVSVIKTEDTAAAGMS